MAYSDDAVKAKLAALNETQDSIVTVAQWIMFHRRHADRTAALWLSRLQESSTSKRLNLLYLANEVVQQSRARSKTDFLIAFEPLIADATALAYKNASVEIQNKIKRVVEVWRQRQIFDLRIQEGAEKRMQEIDKSRGGKSGGGGGKLGGSLFGGQLGGSVPPELESLSKSQSAVSKAEVDARGVVATANIEYAKATDAVTPLPTPPVHAARLSALMKNLATAHGALEASIKTRREHLSNLEALLSANRTAIATEEKTAQDLKSRRDRIEDRKKEVEDGIMRGLSTPTSPTNSTPTALNGNGNNNNVPEPAASEPEYFTPPPPEVESFTPPPAIDDPDSTAEPNYGIGSPSAAETAYANPSGAETLAEQPPIHDEPPPSFEPPPALPQHQQQDAQAHHPAVDILASFQLPQVRQASAELPPVEESADPRLKRRKLSHKSSKGVDEEIFGANGVDEDGVAAMLQ